MKLAEVRMSPTNELENLPREVEVIPSGPATATQTDREPSAERRAVLDYMLEQACRRYQEQVMATGYREMADELLAIARMARAAQIRALPEE